MAVKVSVFNGSVYIGLHHKIGVYTNIINTTLEEWLELLHTFMQL